MKTVLIIDDSEELRETVSEILKDAGYAVECAGSPGEAFKLCDQNKPNLVICDLVLPMDDTESDGDDEQMESAMVGVHAISEISKKYGKLPVIAISGELVGAPLQAMAQFGAVQALSKPFGRDELLAAVEKALRV